MNLIFLDRLSGFEDLFQRANIAHRAFHKIYSARVEPYLERQFRINGADPEYTALLERTLAVWPSIEARFQKVRLVPCHGDSHAENFIVSREGAVSVIDWEHYGWAPMGADLVWVFADRLGCPEFEACLDQYFDGVSPGMSGDERRYLVAILAIFAAMNKGQHLSIKWLRYLNA